MTRADAVSTGQGAATRFGKVFIVYRLPAWPPDVYGCRAEEKGLPPGTETFERLAPGGNATAKEVASKRPGQDRLFFEDAGADATTQVPTFDAAAEELDDDPVDWSI